MDPLRVQVPTREITREWYAGSDEAAYWKAEAYRLEAEFQRFLNGAPLAFPQPPQPAPDDASASAGGSGQSAPDAAPEEDSDPTLEVTRVIVSQFSGACVANRSHTIKKGDRVGKVRRSDNPFLVIQGVACKNCTRNLPAAED